MTTTTAHSLPPTTAVPSATVGYGSLRKPTADSLHPPLSLSIPDKNWLAIYSDLFKARLTTLALFTMLAGFYLGFRGHMDYLRMLHALLATGLVASGASALNQLWERKLDATMRRTQDRPLPAGNLRPGTVLLIGCSTSLAGLIYLALAVNRITALLGAASLLSYIFVYTPLKRVTWLNTVVGAVPGALPPLMGWTAARGEISAEGLGLFAIQALWQVPHFLAIAWIYRDEYAKAGFKMLPVIDPEGRRCGRQAVLFTLALMPISVSPFYFKIAGPVYLCGALVLGALFLWSAIQFRRDLTLARARQLFYLSVLYLPLLLAVMALDKARS
ncbi:MAG: protoheme IX farnesyltransferase [Verrucomicrobia bacterium]|nr:MAG: protoheme IX farnesyltransferase [Verrucomicrobiota bacterium]